MRNKSKYYNYKIAVAISLCLIISQSCHVTKFIPKDKELYDGTEIELKGATKVESPSDLKYHLREISQPKPNKNIWLWMHYRFGNANKKRSIGNLLKKKFGQIPVYYDESASRRNVLVLQKYLSDQGYFNSKVTYDTSSSQKKVEVTYHVDVLGRHRIGNVHIPRDSSNIGKVISDIKDLTLLQEGSYYSLEKLADERNRIAIEARNQGYYDFGEDGIFYFVDTNATKSDTLLTSDIWLKIKESDSGEDYKRHIIGNTFVYPNYDLSRAGSIVLNDSIQYQDLRIYQNNQILKPATLASSIVQHKGEVYSEERHIATTNHLLDLGIYKFVNVRYRKHVQNDTNYLDRYIYLTPGKVQNVEVSLSATTRPGAFGAAVNTNYSHKNIFGGAERLDLGVSGGFENGGLTQLTENDIVSSNVSEFTARADLTFPRYIVPFVKVNSQSSFHIPRTRISTLANFQYRPEIFSLASYRLGYGYDWEETRRKRHQIDLLSFNLLQIYNRTEAFLHFLEENPGQERSFSNLFLLGSSYTYTLTNQELSRPGDYYFLLGKMELSGNSAYLVSKLINPNKEDTYQIFNRDFSQFTKVDLDYRYNKLTHNGSLVTKLSAGIGLAYLNSTSIPYAKQYFAGGAYSMRGFPPRSLLGSHAVNSLEEATTSFEQVGDVKLEWNTEWRFDLLQALYLKGALFLDIGNTWQLDLHNEIVDRSKVFSTDRFLSEMAIASGFGVRLDIQYFVLRVDLGLPLKVPFLPKGSRWTFDEIHSWPWLKKNAVFNFALGYPF